MRGTADVSGFVASAADHHEIDARERPVGRARHHVGVDAAVGLHVLPHLDARERAHLVAVRGGQLVLLPRSRRLRKGLYRLRIEANGLGGVRRRIPSTVLFRLT